jgi:hypothetical protein
MEMKRVVIYATNKDAFTVLLFQLYENFFI